MLIDSVPAEIKVECWEDGSMYITRSQLGTSNHFVDGDGSPAYQARSVVKWLFGHLKPGETREFTLQQITKEKVSDEKPHPERQADGDSES